MTDYSSSEIVFQVLNEQCERLIAWQQSLANAIIRAQLDSKGYANAILFRGDGTPKQITDLPKMGEAKPSYGLLDEAYHYTFFAQKANWFLRTTNVSRVDQTMSPDGLPTLEIPLMLLPQVLSATDEWHAGSEGKYHVGFAFEFLRDENRMMFRLTSDIYPQFANWLRFGQALTCYEFTFIPMTIGCTVIVTDTDSKETINLTQDIDW